MADDAIVAFLDILGYENIVQKMIDDPGFIKRFDDLMYKITVDHKNELFNMKREDVAEHELAYFKRVVGTLKVRCIYDSVIFSMSLSDIGFSSEEYNQEETTVNCIQLLFSSIAMFASFFMGKMGTLLRGGISIGPHFESEKDNYLFIFSEAHNKAVRLEAATKHPRILLDDNLKTHLRNISYPIDKFFYKDEDGRYCFDIYSAFNILGRDLSKRNLTDIKEGITLNIKSNIENDEVLSKLRYFARYHNRRVKELNFANLTINID